MALTWQSRLLAMTKCCTERAMQSTLLEKSLSPVPLQIQYCIMMLESSLAQTMRVCVAACSPPTVFLNSEQQLISSASHDSSTQILRDNSLLIAFPRFLKPKMSRRPSVQYTMEASLSRFSFGERRVDVLGRVVCIVFISFDLYKLHDISIDAKDLLPTSPLVRG